MPGSNIFGALDLNFLDRCRKNTPYDENKIPNKEYESITHKREIREIFKQNYFLGFNNFIDNIENISKLNESIKNLKGLSTAGFNSLYKEVKPIGPGERLLYFIVNDVSLAGGTMGGDVLSRGTRYEIKAVEIRQDKRHVGGFFTGRSVDMNSIISDLSIMAGIPSKSQINRSDVKRVKHEKPKEYEQLRKIYANNIYESYFKKYKMIFFDNRSSHEIISIKQIVPDDLDIEEVTQSAIKPLIRI